MFLGKYIDDRKDDSLQKIDSMLKILARTDGYLNSANTKSTILLSLASAMLAAVMLNYDKFLSRLVTLNDKYVLSLFALISLGLLLLAIYYSIKGVIPYLKNSAHKNIFSFVDLLHYYENIDDYINALSEKNNVDTVKALAALNYNLSGALIKKYSFHAKAIECIILSLLSIGLMILVIVLSQI